MPRVGYTSGNTRPAPGPHTHPAPTGTPPQAAGRPLFRNAFTRGSPDGSPLFNPLDLNFKNVANTGVLYWGGRLWALWEVGQGASKGSREGPGLGAWITLLHTDFERHVDPALVQVSAAERHPRSHSRSDTGGPPLRAQPPDPGHAGGEQHGRPDRAAPGRSLPHRPGPGRATQALRPVWDPGGRGRHRAACLLSKVASLQARLLIQGTLSIRVTWQPGFRHAQLIMKACHTSLSSSLPHSCVVTLPR